MRVQFQPLRCPLQVVERATCYHAGVRSMGILHKISLHYDNGEGEQASGRGNPGLWSHTTHMNRVCTARLLAEPPVMMASVAVSHATRWTQGEHPVVKRFILTRGAAPTIVRQLFVRSVALK